MAWEAALLLWTQNTVRHEWLDPVIARFTQLGNAGILWIVITLILLIIPVLAREYFYINLPKRTKARFGQVFWIPELLLVFGLSVYCIYRGMNDPFLYFRF